MMNFLLNYYSFWCILIKSKYYPPLLLLIFLLLIGPRIPILIGFLIGYIEAFGYLKWIILSKNTAVRWE